MRCVWVLVLMGALLMGCSSTPNLPEDGHDSPAAANAQLGLAYLQQGNHEMARRKLQRALELDPDQPNAHHYLAELYKRRGREEKAERHFRQALALDGEDPRIHNNFGVLLCGQGRVEEADKHFRQAIEHPDYGTPELAYENAGVCALKAERRGQGAEYLRQALDINPQLPVSLYQLASIKHQEGDLAQAKALVDRYFNAAQPTPEALWLGVRVERALGNEDAASTYAMLLKERFPDAEQTQKLSGQDQS